jgi:hypothetical protein
MYYTKIRLAGSTTVDLPIKGALPTDTFILKGVDGIGPPQIDVSIANTLYQGGVYQNRRPQNKQIVIRIGMNPDYSVGETPADIRSLLYSLLTGGYTDAGVLVMLMDDTDELARIQGYISKFEIVPFSKDPEVQLTIDCVSAYFEAPLAVHPSLGAMSKSAPSFTNDGTGPTGFEFSITFTGTLSYWALTGAGGLKQMRFNYPFSSGDILSFGTVDGNRYANVVDGGVPASLLTWMTPESEWMQLYTGLNTFTTSSSSFNWGDISYKPRFWGV